MKHLMRIAMGGLVLALISSPATANVPCENLTFDPWTIAGDHHAFYILPMNQQTNHATYDATSAQALQGCKQEMQTAAAEALLRCVEECTQYECDASLKKGPLTCSISDSQGNAGMPTITATGNSWTYDFHATGSTTATCKCKGKRTPISEIEILD